MSGQAKRAAVSLDHSTFGEQVGGRRVWIATDAVLTLALLALVALAFLPVYGTAWLFVTVLGFGAVGIGIGIVSALRRWNTVLVFGVSVVAWFLLGGLLAMPSSTIAFVVPTPRTLYGLLVGPVTAWRDMLTLDPPIGETFNLLTVPGLAALVAGLAAMLISLRTRMPAMAWAPPALAYLVGVVVGAQVAFHPYLVGAAFFVVVLLWTSHRRAVTREHLSGTPTRLKPVRALLAAATLALAGVVALTVAPLAAGGQRDNLRAMMEPPIDLEQYASPLQGFRANMTQDEARVLFDVVGAEPDDVIRIATLDKYDGLSYRVATLNDEAVEATTFTRVGQWIADDTPGAERDVTVTVRGYQGVWTPTVGRTTSIDFTGSRAVPLSESFFYNRSSGTGLVTAGLREGDTYQVGAVVPARPSDAEISGANRGSMTLPEVTGVPDEILNMAQAWSEGSSTDGQILLRLEEELRKGYFSHGQADEVLSLPGHSERRLITLLSAPERMVGDHEQYAVAMALMAREIGIPARVIYGYQVGGAQGITGAQAGAWPEAYLAGLGWVRFDPTPPKDRILNEEDLPKPPQPQPYIENPPPPPLRPEVPPPDEQLPIDPGTPPEREDRIDWAQIGALAILTGIPLVTIVVPIALILGLKARRRARRRNDPVIANRIAGAWSELVDRARDMGRSPSASATRSEQAEAMVEDFSKLRSKSDPIALAKEADWLVFAPGEPSEQVAKEYWGASGAIKRGMRTSVNWLRWLGSYLSTKSFRRIK